jgi:hypothetical protein
LLVAKDSAKALLILFLLGYFRRRLADGISGGYWNLLKTLGRPGVRRTPGPPLRQVFAENRDMKTTARYIHPRDESMQEAMDRNRAAREARLARSGHTSGHTAEKAESAAMEQPKAIN